MYRDETEALRARIAALEADLHGKEAEVDRQRAELARLGGALAVSEEQVRALRRELEQRILGARSGRGGRVAVAVGGLLALTVVAGAAGFVLLRSRPPPPAPPPVVAQAPAPPAPALRPAPPDARTVEAHFGARVRRATGVALAPGSACAVDVTLTAASTGRIAPKLSCGANVLYDGTKPGARMISASGIHEYAGAADDAWRYRVRLSQKGLSDSQGIALDTSAGTLEIWTEKPPVHRVLLDVDDLSADRRGLPLFADSIVRRRERAGLAAHATVKSATGAAPVKVGATCEVRLEPALDTPTCSAKLRVQCGPRVLYGEGRSGFPDCEARGGKVVSVKDDDFTPRDTDPAVTFDVPVGALRISDETPTAKYAVELAVDG